MGVAIEVAMRLLGAVIIWAIGRADLERKQWENYDYKEVELQRSECKVEG